MIMRILWLLTLTLLLSSCASIILPRKQNVTFNTGNKESVVYVNNVKIGEGKVVKNKIKKKFIEQVVVQTPDYFDTHHCIAGQKHPAAYYPLRALSWFTFYGIFMDGKTGNCYNYPSLIQLPKPVLKPQKGSNQKYLQLESINLDIKDVKNDIVWSYPKYSVVLTPSLEEAEKEKKDDIVDAEEKQSKKDDGKEYLEKKKETDDNVISQYEPLLSKKFEALLKETNYIDTVNKVFADHSNTLSIEGKITKISKFKVRSKNIIKISYSTAQHFYKVKLYITWYIKNDFNEILDSVNTFEYSGDFLKYERENIYFDALQKSYAGLQSNKTFEKYFELKEDVGVPETLLSLKTKNTYISETSEANESTVIVKNGKAHGSGFAITNDGYIITNYHVIAGKYADKEQKISVILPNQEEVDATIVRYNKSKDLALLKVDTKFSHVYKIPTEKTFKNMLNIFTIGAPKSIELGQSVSTGIVSNERKINNNYLIQLNMSVNSGNSGGPVFDKQANLHGVIVSKLFGFSTEGICFAIPAYKITEYLNIDIK